jgi:uncharacterized protein (TIGR01777 family)
MTIAKKVLITGGSGLIGQALTRKLLLKGYKVAHLSRRKGHSLNVETFYWDVERRYLEPGALKDVAFIIHLAGAGVFDSAWTPGYKKEIIESRVHSAALLLENVLQANLPLKAFISASGVAFYGPDTGENVITESSPAGEGFLTEVVLQWENAADAFQKAGIRTVKLRTGIVFDKKGGALEKLVAPIRFGVGAPLGTGHQYIPWVHIADLCDMYLFAIESNTMEGVYNAVGPYPVTNKEFTIEAAKILKRPLLMPHVPSFILKRYMGEARARYILGGNRILTPKIENEGFKFEYPVLHPALSNLFL